MSSELVQGSSTFGDERTVDEQNGFDGSCAALSTLRQSSPVRVTREQQEATHSTPVPSASKRDAPLPPSSLARSLQASFNYHVNTSELDDSYLGDASAPSSPAQDRNALVTELFGWSVGEYLGEFHATYYRIPGQFFVATQALLFYSNWLGFERRFCLTFSDIETIQSYRNTSIKISMIDCEEYIFKKFQDRDTVVLVLQELLMRYQVAVEKGEDLVDPPTIPRAFHQSSIGYVDETPTQQLQPSESLPTLRLRLSSDHAPELQDMKELGLVHPNRRRALSVPTMMGQGDSRQLVIPNIAVESVNTGVSKTFGLPKSLSNLIETSTRRPSTENLEIESPELLQTHPRSRSCHSENGDHTIMDDSCMHLFAHPITPPAHAPKLSQHQINQYVEQFDIWLKENQAYEHVAVEPTQLSLSPSEFFDLFFSDSAPHSLAKYQNEQIGDKDIKFTSWMVSDGGRAADVLVLERDIDYVHPLNNSMGPSEAKTSRKQKCCQYGNHAIVIQNITSVEGIPMADCFQVHDQWIIIQNQNSDSENIASSTLSVSFQIDFMKRTMFKSLIQKNVKAETKKWFQGYLEMLKIALKEHHEADMATIKPESKSDPQELIDDTSLERVRTKETETANRPTDARTLKVETSRGEPFTAVISPFIRSWNLGGVERMILIGLLVVLLIQMQSTKSTLHTMEERLFALETQNRRLLELLQNSSARSNGQS
ncbi:protein of unknown function DUF4782 containing protein [Nitzschia inconspicua]|uniref:VASt domain-containing protein n=1 Tax=Nitzschia inconspicua TaxID=303405 RepID=A0A9K3KDM9_9STRA|nr:protein of unknown function DUF4782 containing protein [Nitzschia inconspicua]